MDYSNRTYAFALTSDVGEVDFSQVMETSAATVRKSINETQFILKWYTADWPTFAEPSPWKLPEKDPDDPPVIDNEPVIWESPFEWKPFFIMNSFAM